MRLLATIAALAIALAIFFASYYAPSKADLIKQAEGATTRADLEAALGEPSDVAKLGPIEKWTYKASDGAVVFVLAGDSITFEVTEDP